LLFASPADNEENKAKIVRALSAGHAEITNNARVVDTPKHVNAQRQIRMRVQATVRTFASDQLVWGKLCAHPRPNINCLELALVRPPETNQQIGGL
jgi:hypothetical protein